MTKPPHMLRPFVVKLPAQMRDALFLEAARRTIAKGAPVSACSVARDMIAERLGLTMEAEGIA